MREAMTAGDDILRGLLNLYRTCSELVGSGSRMRICNAWVRQRVLRVRTKVCSSKAVNERGLRTKVNRCGFGLYALRRIGRSRRSMKYVIRRGHRSLKKDWPLSSSAKIVEVVQRKDT